MARRPKISHTPQHELELFEEGLRLFNAGEFFEAHEVWEDAWWPAEGEKRLFLQALIQISVAFQHWRRRNPGGAMMLYRAALEKFARVSGPMFGVNPAAVADQFTAAFTPLINTAPNVRYSVPFRPEHLFVIERAG